MKVDTEGTIATRCQELAQPEPYCNGTTVIFRFGFDLIAFAVGSNLSLDFTFAYRSYRFIETLEIYLLDRDAKALLQQLGFN